MAMTNAERQARYKQRLREAATGVTPDMVLRAARVIFEHVAANDPSAGTWAEHIARSHQRRFRDNWPELVPDDTTPGAYDFLDQDDRALVERVAAVVHASRKPPPIV